MDLSLANSILKTGQEPFHATKKPLNFQLIHFWQWSASDLVSNALRGRLAEFLVAQALGLTLGMRREWDAYDLCTADGITIEIKSSAYLQTWNQNGISKICFDIRPTQSWNYEANEYSAEKKRQADVYIFCLLHHQDRQTLDPMDVLQWKFYVVPTKILNERLPQQKNLSLGKLLKLGIKTYDYFELPKAIKESNIKGSGFI